MELEKIIKSLKFVPKIWTAISFLLLLATVLILFFGRNFEHIRINILSDTFPEFYRHISNFSISLAIYIIIGYVGLMTGLTIKHFVFIGIAIALLNLIIELSVSFLNTPDITDAVYGIFSVTLGLIFLIVAKRYGLIENELLQTNTSS